MPHLLHNLPYDLSLLIVDDNPIHREILCGIVEDLFERIDIANDGNEAIDKMSKHGYDLVILDLHIKYVTSFDFLRRIRGEDNHVPIFVISSDTDSEHLIELINEEVSGFVSRPFNERKIIRQLHKICSSLLDRKLIIKYQDILEEHTLELDVLNRELRKSNQDLFRQKEENNRLLTVVSRQSVVSEMVGNIAHQWRTPLTQIGSVLSKLESKSKYELLPKDELDESLKELNDLIVHMSSTIDLFQGFFTKKDQINSFEINTEILRCLSFVKNVMTINDINVNFIRKDDVMVIGDKNSFAQVVLNIFANAKDAFTQSLITNRELTITISEVSKKLIQLEIKDNGGGVKVQPIEQIFDPYITTKHLSGEGVGIGLFIVKRIVEEQLFGSISVMNNDLGAVFSLKLLIASNQ